MIKAKAIRLIDLQISKFEELQQDLLRRVELKSIRTKPTSTSHDQMIRRPKDASRLDYPPQATGSSHQGQVPEWDDSPSYDFKSNYDVLYSDTEDLLAHLFPAEEAKKFGNNAINQVRSLQNRYDNELLDLVLGDDPDDLSTRDYFDSIKDCIHNLEKYGRTIEVFWDDTVLSDPLQRSISVQNLEIQYLEGLTMGDTYNVEQAGAVGPSSHAHDMVFNKISTQSGDTIDLPKLAKELSVLRMKMKGIAVEPEQDVAVGAIAQAETAAKNGHAPKVLESLAKAGKWALDIATQIGTTVAVAAIKASLGLP